MNATVTLDRAGRVVIPKTLRSELRLDAGDEMELTLEGDCLTLRPVRVVSRMQKKQGFWVFGGTGPISAEDTNVALAEIREQRNRQNRGDDD